MFKRSLASVAAVAVVSGAIVAPANAMTLKVDDDVTCTINLNVKEADILHLNHPGNKDPQGSDSYLKDVHKWAARRSQGKIEP